MFRRFDTILIALSIFISSYVFFKQPFEGYFHYIIFLILLPMFVLRYGPPRHIMPMLFVLLIVGVLQVIVGNDETFLFIKIFGGLLLSASFYYYVLRHYDFDVDFLFKMYLQGAYYAALIGVVQLVAFRLHITPLYDFHWLFNKWGLSIGSIAGIRVNSVFSEPAQCAIVMAPAATVATYELLFRKRFFFKLYQSVIVLLVFAFTFSSTGYIGFFVIMLMLSINFGQISRFLLGLLFGGVALVFLYRVVPEFQERVNTTIALWVYQDYSVENVNTSSFILYNNFHIAWENFKSNFLFGTGLGSHQVAFENYSLTKNADILNFTFNQSDGNSMFVRLMSETGLSGLIFIFVFIRRHFIRRNTFVPHNMQWLISSSLISIIVLYLLRQGNYFVNGFPFFMWLYYYNSVTYRRKMMEIESGGGYGRSNAENGEVAEVATA